MLIYNIKTLVKFNLGYNPLIFDGLWAFFKVMAHLAGASVSYGHISSFLKLHVHVHLYNVHKHLHVLCTMEMENAKYFGCHWLSHMCITNKSKTVLDS